MYRHILSVLFILMFSSTGFAQTVYNQVPQVKLANIDSAYTTFATILSNPRLTTGAVNCQVTEFTISFTVKDGATYGPYPTRGFMLTDEQKIVLKNLRDKRVRVLIEHINMRCDQQDIQPRNIVVDFDH